MTTNKGKERKLGIELFKSFLVFLPAFDEVTNYLNAECAMMIMMMMTFYKKENYPRLDQVEAKQGCR